MTALTLIALLALPAGLGVVWIQVRRQTAELDALRRASADRDDAGDSDSAIDLMTRAQLFERALAPDNGREPETGGFGMIAIGPSDLAEMTDGLRHGAVVQIIDEIARRLDRNTRSSEWVAQTSDGHFVLVLGAPITPYGAIRAATRLTECLAAPIEVDGMPLTVGVFAGVALGEDPEQVLDDAEFALSRARQTRQTAPVLYDPEERARVEATFWRAQCLRSAVDREELHVAYQPLLSLETGRIDGVEALLRWHSPTLGAVSPADFIPIAEDTGTIVELGGWVLERACRDLHEIAGDDGHVKVSVNVSVHQLRHPGFLDIVKTALMATDLDPARLQVEVTESMFAVPAEVTPKLNALRELGVSIALDDVGTGYSSLGQLATLPIDVIKLDRTLLAQREEDGDAADRIFTSIAALGRSLGLEVVAEGVETEEQSAVARRAGCTHEQGFLRSRPVPVDEVAAFARARRAGDHVA